MIGAKPPLRPKHVLSIRAKLQMAGRIRDLAMFNLAIDSKLRGCDVVNLKVEDVAPHGHAVDRANVRQRKTGQPIRFEMSESLLVSDATTSAFDPSSFCAARLLSGFLPVTMTSAPSARKSFAVARPMPVLPPVMSAILPSSFDIPQ